MSQLTWAENETKLAKQYNEEVFEYSHDREYYNECYDSAYKAFKSLMSDRHSGSSISITLNILNRLVAARPLTPIKDVNDIWIHVTDYDHFSMYQCGRMSSLFKRVYKNGTTTHYDNDRWVMQYERGLESQTRFYSGFTSKIMDTLYPITFPYEPFTDPMVVYQDEFLINNVLVIGVLYFLNNEHKKIGVDQYFKRTLDQKTMEKIDIVHYKQLEYEYLNKMISEEITIPIIENDNVEAKTDPS